MFRPRVFSRPAPAGVFGLLLVAATFGPGSAAAQGPAPAADAVKAPKGFKVEVVHAVARDGEGSWVSMTVDPKDRLIVSDQYGKLFRVTPSPLGGRPEQTKVEPVDVPIGEAQGLLWAFDSLYVVVNRGHKYDSGLYRVRDTDGDDKLDKVELLRKLDGSSEHGPHAVVLSPDGQSLYVVAGNATKRPEPSASLVPLCWGEDNLIPRLPDGSGFMTDEKAPGGWVARTGPDGKEWTLIATGFRNAYDLAFNRDGELFTYDSDMEWDANLPWYRPTRVCQVVPGAEFGYRNGSGKWPTYYMDSLPPVAEIGPGSPTGVAFGYKAKFPTKYRNALFICDWSYGKLYALHLAPSGATYKAEVEEFLAGSPLPLTDLVVNPGDGALYFTTGGRKTASSLYRVVYDGAEPTDDLKVVLGPDDNTEARSLRQDLAKVLGRREPGVATKLWRQLGHPDRYVRFTARAVLEFQDPSEWREKALAETDPAVALPALLALARVSAVDPAHRKAADPQPDPALRDRIIEALARVPLNPDDLQRSLDLARVYEVVLNRFGKPDAAASAGIVARLDPLYPARSRELNAELAQVLIVLDAPDAAAKTVALLQAAPTQEEQITDANDLRVLKTGWTPGLRRAYLTWFARAAGYKGGNSFPGFIRQIRAAAVANLSESEKAEVADVLDPKSSVSTQAGPVVPPRPHVRDWTVEELMPVLGSSLGGPRRDFDRGRSLFAAASCYACHRFNNEGGGAGPELTGVSGRFGTRDLLESIIAPSKVVSDQYAAVMVSTSDGQVVTGRIVNLNNNTIFINTNMLEPNTQTHVDRSKIDEMKPSTVSMMPAGLLNTMDAEEVADLFAYILSRGDRNRGSFK